MSAELDLLSRIRTLADAVAAFSDDDCCRRLLEAMVWPAGIRVVGHGQGFINALTRIAGSNSR